MNERIKQLARQTGIIDTELLNESQSIMLEKFAELIVCSAIQHLKDRAQQKGDVTTTVGTVEKELLQHFGVEE
jgi:hypothetical protein